MIGEGLWTRRFGRDPAILNRTIQIDGKAVRVVGIIPGWFLLGRLQQRHYYAGDLALTHKHTQ